MSVTFSANQSITTATFSVQGSPNATFSASTGGDNVSFTIQKLDGSDILSETFETISKNLRANNTAPKTFLPGQLIEILQINNGEIILTKTVKFSNGRVSSIELSGSALPANIPKKKEASYIPNNPIPGWTYIL